jgi:hypothetical protein
MHWADPADHPGFGRGFEGSKVTEIMKLMSETKCSPAVRNYVPNQALYVMQNQHGLIKVGRSLDPELRRRALEYSEECSISLVLVRPNEGHREEEVHLQLGEHRVAGEWFDCTPQARRAIEAALAPDQCVAWPCTLDRAGAKAWLEGFWERQDTAHIQREISRAYSRLRDMNEPGWVWDGVLWDLHWLMETGIRPSGSVERDANGAVVQRTWVEGQELMVPRFTAERAAAMTLWPEGDRPAEFPGSVVDCCKAAIEARRARWRNRMGLRRAGSKPIASGSRQSS